MAAAWLDQIESLFIDRFVHSFFVYLCHNLVFPVLHSAVCVSQRLVVRSLPRGGRLQVLQHFTRTEGTWHRPSQWSVWQKRNVSLSCKHGWPERHRERERDYERHCSEDNPLGVRDASPPAQQTCTSAFTHHGFHPLDRQHITAAKTPQKNKIKKKITLTAAANEYLE